MHLGIALMFILGMSLLNLDQNERGLVRDKWLAS